MKGADRIACYIIVIAFIFSNTLIYLEIEPEPEIFEYHGPGYTFVRPQPVNPTNGPIPNSNFTIMPTQRRMSNLSYEEYKERWYGDELGFNEGLISSCKRLTTDGNKGSAAFSPDGKRIIYTSKEDGGEYSDIWMMDVDGTNHTQLTFADYGQSQPSFLSDGIHFMFVTPGPESIRVWIKNLENNSTRYYDIRGCHPSPAPGNRIIYTSNCTKIADMYFKNITCLPEGFAKQWPHMDSSGTIIASEDYQVNMYNQLYLSDLRTNVGTQVASDEINHNDPAISPDGKMIVYDTYCSPPASSYSNLWLYDVISGYNYHLTIGPTVDAMAEFSPDGRHIIFGSTRGNQGWSFDLWLITLKEDR